MARTGGSCPPKSASTEPVCAGSNAAREEFQPVWTGAVAVAVTRLKAPRANIWQETDRRAGSKAQEGAGSKGAGDPRPRRGAPPQRYFPPRSFGNGGSPRRPATRKWRNQSRTWTAFSTLRNGVPERVSSWLSSGTRIRRTGRRSERRTVNSSSPCPIGVRRSFSPCWMRSGVRIRSA